MRRVPTRASRAASERVIAGGERRNRRAAAGKYPPAKPGAYMRLRKSRVFSWSFFRGIFYRTIAFVKDVVRAVEQREACVCIHGMIALFAWPRRAVNPRSPQGRA